MLAMHLCHATRAWLQGAGTPPVKELKGWHHDIAWNDFRGGLCMKGLPYVEETVMLPSAWKQFNKDRGVAAVDAAALSDPCRPDCHPVFSWHREQIRAMRERLEAQRTETSSPAA